MQGLCFHRRDNRTDLPPSYRKWMENAVGHSRASNRRVDSASGNRLLDNNGGSRGTFLSVVFFLFGENNRNMAAIQQCGNGHVLVRSRDRIGDASVGIQSWTRGWVVRRYLFLLFLRAPNEVPSIRDHVDKARGARNPPSGNPG